MVSSSVFLILTAILISQPLSFGWEQGVLFNPEHIALIQQRIGYNIIYPLEAIYNRWEGVVKVRFTLMPDGHIKRLGIAKSSGYPLLDEAVVSAVKSASPYPSLGYSLRSEEVEVILPVNYQSPQEATRIVKKPIQKPLKIPRFPPSPLEVETAPRSKPAQPPPQPLQGPAADLTELEGFIELAIKNNQPTQIAQEEIELAELKVGEAQRNLFPALKFEAYNTDGEVYRVEYEEREAKFQLDQPIYYGGRLRDSLKQAGVNLEITKRNYDRLRIDTAHKSEVAYYNLVAHRMNLKIQEALRTEAKEILRIVERESAADMVTPLEMSSAQSAYEQISFQIDSIKQDLAMAELTFMQVLNVADLPEISRQRLEILKLGLDLNACLQAGLDNRPEIYLSELLVQFNQYGKRIEDAKNNFTVDFTSTYSFYEGAWKTESMQNSNNWYLGIKATKPLGGSTATASATTEDLQPRYGQTSPTKATTLSAEINFLDNLARLSEAKRVDIDLQRSLSDLNETSKTILFEIKDAYFNYQKALLQATTAQSETVYRYHQKEVLKVRAQVGDMDFSNVMESIISLSRAQTSYIQALANYFISLANLRKAAGYGIRL